jgi:hypothetical protein
MASLLPASASFAKLIHIPSSQTHSFAGTCSPIQRTAGKFALAARRGSLAFQSGEDDQASILYKLQARINSLTNREATTLPDFPAA